MKASLVQTFAWRPMRSLSPIVVALVLLKAGLDARQRHPLLHGRCGRKTLLFSVGLGIEHPELVWWASPGEPVVEWVDEETRDIRKKAATCVTHRQTPAYSVSDWEVEISELDKLR